MKFLVCYTDMYISVNGNTHADFVSKTCLSKIYIDIQYISNQIISSHAVFVGVEMIYNISTNTSYLVDLAF